MPKNPTKGTKQVLLELPESLVEQAKEFASSRGETFKQMVIEAIRRHMAYPSPPPPPPAPEPTPAPFPDDSATAPSKKGKKR